MSARFRLPLAPLICAVAGGIGALPAIQQASRKIQIGAAASILGLAALIYGNWANAQDSSTFIQDKALLAISANHIGADALAIQYFLKLCSPRSWSAQTCVASK